LSGRELPRSDTPTRLAANLNRLSHDAASLPLHVTQPRDREASSPSRTGAELGDVVATSAKDQRGRLPPWARAAMLCGL